MKVSYDLHIHSCLSPCADIEMTPNNIVNMSVLNGLNVIAITDHNSCKNCKALVEAGKKANLLVIPGMEICTNEDIHVICLFETVTDAENFSTYVYSNMPLIPHRPDIFGEQIIMNSNDIEISRESYLLLNATNISVNDILSTTNKYNGTAFPAHIDRSSYSVISSLGDIPPEAGFNTIEISTKGNIEKMKSLHPIIKDKLILINSDSHYLENLISEKRYIEIDTLSTKSSINYINGN